jgi:hypothetical protein
MATSIPIVGANSPRGLGNHNLTAFFRQRIALSTDGMLTHVVDGNRQIHLTAPPETI